MADHNVAIDCDGQYGKQRDRQQPVPHHRKQPTEQIPIQPGLVPEGARGQRQVEAAEQQIGER